MLADGLSYRVIAVQLGILDASIKTRMDDPHKRWGAIPQYMAVAASFRRAGCCDEGARVSALRPCSPVALGCQHYPLL